HDSIYCESNNLASLIDIAKETVKEFGVNMTININDTEKVMIMGNAGNTPTPQDVINIVNEVATLPAQEVYTIEDMPIDEYDDWDVIDISDVYMLDEK